MNIACARCGGAMVVGPLKGTGNLLDTDAPLLSLVLSSGTPTSINPVKEFLLGFTGEPDDLAKERKLSVCARACTRCGTIEFCLSPDDLKLLAGAQPQE